MGFEIAGTGKLVVDAEDRPKQFHSTNIETELGPGMLCCSACTWINISSSNKTQRNCMGLKTTACVCSQGQNYGQKIQKRPKTQLLKELGGKQAVQSKSRVWYMGPPLPHGKDRWPAFREHAREPVTFYASSLIPLRGPNKALFEFFLSGLWPISIDWEVQGP